ncbi:MAG: hypothetical protein M3O71_04425 [Bacteroidota bacterium]|nr:hypothetical protein [Bacteroidota bacterium]
MKGSAKLEESQTADVNQQAMRALKHDVKNQLSNILLAIEQLRYEIPEPSADCIFYLDSISLSSARIDNLLKEVE